MLKKSLIAGLMGLAAVSAATPTFAQSLEIGRGGVRLVDPNDDVRSSNRSAVRDEITEREAIRIARGEGLRNVDDVNRTRRAYRVVGTDRSGDDIRVDVDRYTGDVISVR